MSNSDGYKSTHRNGGNNNGATRTRTTIGESFRDQGLAAFLHANGGTLFISEVTELAPSLQENLLRVIHKIEIADGGGSSPLNVRVIATTTRVF